MRRLVLAAFCLLAACSSSADEVKRPKSDPFPQDLRLTKLNPGLLLPGTRISVRGGNFVPENIGPARLILSGDFAGTAHEAVLAATYESSDQLYVSWPATSDVGLSVDQGSFVGKAVVEIDEDDGKTHKSAPLEVQFDFAPSISPDVQDVAQGVIFVNDPIEVQGSQFLLGGQEGETVAVLEGCFQPEGTSTCSPVDTAEVVALPIVPYDRTRVAFPFAPSIAGIHTGTFRGNVAIRNRHGEAANSVTYETEPRTVQFELTDATIFGISPPAASLGQYVNIEGGGFVGVPAGSVDDGLAITTLGLTGSYARAGTAGAVDVDVTLVPEFVSGKLVRYVVSEQDDLGRRVNLREDSGEFSGSIQATTQYGKDTVEGSPFPAKLRLNRIRQVVWVKFLAAYVGSLRHFGLRAVDPLIRQRVFEVAARDYVGVNMDFRAERPEDFAQYARVEIGGPDPNGFGMLGYDNSPGKDIGNKRLYDQIGGVNAKTQEDGFPGYGGVFVESFFGFSEHPGSFAEKLGGSDPTFDSIFDPFRADVGGRPVEAQDLADLDIPRLTSGDGCPAESGDRGMQIACAVWTIGSMIGSTMTHEVGHSLGLADPYGGEFHNLGDGHNRLMDGGQFRPFLERAEIMGAGPSVFCEEDYVYLEKILPDLDADSVGERPTCW